MWSCLPFSKRAVSLRAAVLSLACLTGMFCAPVHAVDPTGPYKITDLGVLGQLASSKTPASSAALGLNDSGVVVGRSTTLSGQTHAFLYRNGARYDIGSVSGSSEVYTVNSSGEACGSANSLAVLDIDASLTSLGTLGGVDSLARAINNQRQIAGRAKVKSGADHAFLWTAGQMTDLGTFGGFGSGAHGINNTGIVVGRADYSDTQYHAFLWDSSAAYPALVDLKTLGGTNSVAEAVNDLGAVVGTSDLADGSSHGFLWANGRMVDIGILPGGKYSQALAINNRKYVVGSASVGTSSSVTDATLWLDGSLIDLNSLLPAGSGWTLQAATGVNNAGQICGYGKSPSGQVHGFLLTPPAAPTYTLTMLGDLGGSSQAYAVNELGQTAGTSFLPSKHFEAFTSSGAAAPLGFLNGTDSEGDAINNNGIVAGMATDALGDPQAATYSPGTGWVALSASFGGNASAAYGINDSGQVVGYATDGDGIAHGFTAYISDPSHVAELIDSGDGGGAYAVGRSGYAWSAAGYVYNPDGSFHAALLDSFYSPRYLRDLGGSQSCAYALSEFGQAAGAATTPAEDPHAVLFSPVDLAGTRDLGTLGGAESYVYGINSSGETVGVSSLKNGAYHGFAYLNGGLVDLNTLLPPAAQLPGGTPLTIINAYAVNDAGQIAATAADPSGKYHAVLLSPPVPTLRYAITDVGSSRGISATILGTDINNNGQVAGEYRDTDAKPVHAFLYSGGKLTDLTPTDTNASHATGINKNGRVAGWREATNSPQAFYYDTTLHDLGTLSDGVGYYRTGRINSAGQIVGTYAVSNTAASFFWNGTLSRLESAFDNFGVSAINDNGVIAGTRSYPGSALLKDASGLYDLGIPVLAYRAGALALNINNHVAGYSSSSLTNAFHASLYDAGWQDLGSLGGGTSLARYVNSRNQVVGYSLDWLGNSNGFVSFGGASYNLNGLIDPASGWVLTDAVAISDNSFILATGHKPGGPDRALILTPPLPHTTITATGSLGQNGWYTGPVQVTLQPSLAGDTVAATFFYIDSGGLGRYTGTFPVTGDLKHIVHYRSIDKIDNSEAWTTKTINIDTVASTTLAAAAVNAAKTGSDITLTCQDSLSGVNNIFFIRDGGATQTYTPTTSGSTKAVTTFTETNGGPHHLEYWSVDVAGNAETPHKTLDYTVQPGLTGLSYASSSVVGGNAIKATVTLSGTSYTGTQIDLTGGSGLLSFPTPVYVAAGHNSVTFTVGTQPVAATKPLSITATSGTISKTATVSVVPPTINTITLDNTSVKGGMTVTATVSLNGFVAPGSSLDIKITSDSAKAIPDNGGLVTVASGNKTAVLTIQTSSVTANTTVHITATQGSTAKTVVLTLNP